MTIGRPNFIDVGLSENLRSSSARHHITLRNRSSPTQYHTLLLFSFPRAPTLHRSDDVADGTATPRFYCMEAVCPHLGAPLECASIYDVEDEDDIEDAVIVCPWHEYDFSLRTGESSTGLKACVYAVEERGDGSVWVQAPTLENEAVGGWDVIEVRPVSESLTRGREGAMQNVAAAFDGVTISSGNEHGNDEHSDVPKPLHSPKTLVEWAVLVLNTPEPRLKVEYTRQACKSFRNGDCRVIGGGFRYHGEGESGAAMWSRKAEERPPAVPPRLSDAKVVQPGQIARRGKGGSEKSRIAMLHSLANIEQWAIDLAWDIIARAPELYADRNGKQETRLPLQFFSDFVNVPEDEPKHFTLLQDRLEQMGASFGDLPVHHGLWDSAIETMHSLDARLSIIHLVHEARGLDANPLTIKKFANAGDKQSVESQARIVIPCPCVEGCHVSKDVFILITKALLKQSDADEDALQILTIIHLDEVTHVSAGHRWLTYICDHADPKRDPVTVFRDNVRQHFAGKLKGPFNVQDRSRAGLTKEWYEDLVGEKGGSTGVARAEVPGG